MYFANMVFLAILRISRGTLSDCEGENFAEDNKSTVQEAEFVGDAS